MLAGGAVVLMADALFGDVDVEWLIAKALSPSRRP